MDTDGTALLISQYIRLRPFLSLFIASCLGLSLGRLAGPDGREVAGVLTVLTAGFLIWLARGARRRILAFCAILLAAGFGYEATSAGIREHGTAKLLSLENPGGGKGEAKVWQVYLEARTYRALRARGVFVRGKVLGYTEHGTPARLRGNAVWVHFLACRAHSGYMAVPTSELECTNEGSRTTLRLPSIANVMGGLSRMPGPIAEMEEWADSRDSPEGVITADTWIPSTRPEDAAKQDVRRERAAKFLALAGCLEGAREKPVCQMFSVFLGHNLVDIHPELMARFRRTGLVHLVVPSGAQVTFAILLFLYIGQRMRRLRITMVFISIAMVVWSVNFFGGVPMWRAAGVSLIALTGFVLFREGDFLNQTAAVGLTLLVVQPSWLFDPSFQFSILASSGMVLGSQLVRGRGWRPGVIRSAAGTLGAQLLLLPALAGISGIVTPWTALANLIMAPIVSASLAIGYAALAFSVAGWTNAATAIVLPLKGLLWVGLRVVLALAELPIVLRENTTISVAFLVVFGVLVFVALEAFYFESRWKRMAASLTVAALIWMVVPVGVPTAYVYSTGAGTVVHFPREGLWLGSPYSEEWWDTSRRLAVTLTRTGFFYVYPGKPEDPDLSRIAIALSRRHERLRLLPHECNGRGDRHLGVDYCCYGTSAGCSESVHKLGWWEAGALVAKLADGHPFVVRRAGEGLEVVTKDRLYCVSLYPRTDCAGTAVGMAEGAILEKKKPHLARGLWGIQPGREPRKMPHWWFKGIE
jgi:hypothetical protein